MFSRKRHCRYRRNVIIQFTSHTACSYAMLHNLYHTACSYV